jgi:signal transduction histidine kinase
MSSNILELSNLETQTAQPMHDQFSLDEQLRQVMVVLAPLCSEKELELDIVLEDTTIVASQELLETVWLNVLGNAIKFSEPGGMLSVRLQLEGDVAKVSISDTGCGMSEEELPYIFDKFYQADSSHKSEGSGLGLALVGAIINKHSGSIEVTSVLGKGSTFTVALPGCEEQSVS